MTNQYEILCEASGDRAEADTLSAALLAAATLATDHADACGSQGALRIARKSLSVYRVGKYDAALTNMARRGERVRATEATCQ